MKPTLRLARDVRVSYLVTRDSADGDNPEPLRHTYRLYLPRGLLCRERVRPGKRADTDQGDYVLDEWPTSIFPIGSLLRSQAMRGPGVPIPALSIERVVLGVLCYPLNKPRWCRRPELATFLRAHTLVTQRVRRLARSEP